MKKVINGAVYDSEKCETLAKRSVYSNGNYAGADHLCRTTNGNFFVYYSSNGQDCYRYEGIKALHVNEIAQAVDGWRLDDQEAQRLINLCILTDA